MDDSHGWCAGEGMKQEGVAPQNDDGQPARLPLPTASDPAVAPPEPSEPDRGEGASVLPDEEVPFGDELVSALNGALAESDAFWAAGAAATASRSRPSGRREPDSRSWRDV